MIVNIRGTSGSGKTYVVRELMARYAADGMVWAYAPGTKETGGARSGYHLGTAPWRLRPLRVLGYYGGAACGGCDGIATQLDVENLVRAAAQADADCVFEGLLISSVTSRWVPLLNELGVPWKFLFLDTSLEACLQRAVDRRLAKGNHKPFNPHNTTAKYKQVMQRYDSFTQLGLDCALISSDDAAKEIYAFLDPERLCPDVRDVCVPAGVIEAPQAAGADAVDDGPDTGQISFL